MTTFEFDRILDGGWNSGACISEPAQADIGRAFPLWRTWQDRDGRCHALRREGAALQAEGEDWLALLAEIRAAEARLEDSRPAAWRP